MNKSPLNLIASYRTLAVGMVAAAALTSNGAIFFAEDSNPNALGTRGPRTNSDAAHAAFQASFAVTGFESFEQMAPNLAPSPSFNFKTASAQQLRMGSATFTSPPRVRQILGFGTSPTGQYPTHGQRYLEMGGPSGTSLRLSFSQAVAGFGLYITDSQGKPRVVVQYQGGLSQQFVIPTNAPGTGDGSIAFWGINSNVPITGVWLTQFGTTNSELCGIDQLTVGVVPEPASLAILGAGAAAFLARGRRGKS